MNSHRLINSAIIVLIAISLLSALYIFVFQSNRGLSLDLEISPQILSGVPFELKVNFNNNSGTILENVRLTLILPEGAVFFGGDPQKTMENKDWGNIGNGSLMQESYKIILLSSEESNKEFKAVVGYSSFSSGVRFEKKKNLAVEVKSSGVAVEISAPDKIIGGEEIPITIVYQNVSDTDFSDLKLSLEYPPSFIFADSDLKPDSGNNVWLLGNLLKNSEGKFTVKGILIGNQGDVFELKSDLYTRAAGQEYLVNKNSAKISIASSPLSVSVRLNNVPEYAAKTGELLNYTIGYLNTTDAALRDLTVTAQLIGEMFDVNSVQAQGFFRSADNTLIWNSANVPALAVLPPGSAGILAFSVKTKNFYPIRRFSDKNFLLTVNAEVASPTVLNSANISRVFGKTKLESKVFGSLALDARAYFRDAESGFLNKGSFPLKAGQPTNFTIHWLLKSFAADISNIEVRSALGNNVKMVGEPKSNFGFPPAYNSETNEVVWQLDKIQANQGAIGDPIEAIFQVEATPSAQDVGKYMALIGETLFLAKDEFASQELSGLDGQITTALPDDSTVGQQGGIVQP